MLLWCVNQSQSCLPGRDFFEHFDMDCERGAQYLVFILKTLLIIRFIRPTIPLHSRSRTVPYGMLERVARQYHHSTNPCKVSNPVTE